MFQSSLRVFLVLMLCGTFHQAADGQTIGNAMVTFLSGKAGQRVGGGECGHLATEALRVAGGEFVPSDLGADAPAAGDAVWGTLVTTITYSNKKWTDSAPTVAVLPGDIIQYGSAKLGTTLFPTKHTSVVKTVNTVTASRPTAVFQQNFGGVRTVQSATINVTKLTAGWLRIYRPKPRVDAANVWKFTVVNSASTSQSYQVLVDISAVSSVGLTAANNTGSFRVHKITTDGTVPAVVLSSGPSLFVRNGKSDEIYGAPAALRELAQ